MTNLNDNQLWQHLGWFDWAKAKSRIASHPHELEKVENGFNSLQRALCSIPVTHRGKYERYELRLDGFVIWLNAA